MTIPMTSADCMALEDKYGAHNYRPIPVVLKEAKGIYVYDMEDRKYVDFLSAYSAVNQGHCHPKIIKAMKDQLDVLTLTSRAFFNDKLGLAEQMVTTLFHYDKALFMNSGSEAVETGIKLARRWGYDVKGVPQDQAEIIVAWNNFHGRTTGIVSFSTDPENYKGFGPAAPGYIKIPFNDLGALATELKQNPNVVALLLEPIQGEGGVVIPDDGYLRQAHELCQSHRVLFIADEIQTGLGRTGRLLACHHEDVRADILLLGKALSGGTMPISLVLADDEVMLNIKPGQHGSTFGGNPLACVVVMTALRVLQEENMIENAATMGALFRSKMNELQVELPHAIDQVRGKGLLNAIVINEKFGMNKAWDLCLAMKDLGLLAKQTHANVIRFTPPLIITEEEMIDACETIRDAFKALF